MTVTEKMIKGIDKRSASIKVTSGKTPDERYDLLLQRMDYQNKSAVLRAVIR